MKTFSILAMSLACVMTGQYIAYKLNKRVRILEEILLMFGIIENEIGFLSRPTGELITSLASRTELAELDFLPQCALLSKKSENASEALVTALSRSAAVDKAEKQIISSFAESLGRSDIDGQISNCRYHAELTRERLTSARAKRDRLASLSCGLGLLSGLGLFIILI